MSANQNLDEKGNILLLLAKIINQFFAADRNSLKKCIEEIFDKYSIDPEKVLKMVRKLYDQLRSDAPGLDKIYLTILILDYVTNGRASSDIARCVEASL